MKDFEKSDDFSLPINEQPVRLTRELLNQTTVRLGRGEEPDEYFMQDAHGGRLDCVLGGRIREGGFTHLRLHFNDGTFSDSPLERVARLVADHDRGVERLRTPHQQMSFTPNRIIAKNRVRQNKVGATI